MSTPPPPDHAPQPPLAEGEREAAEALFSDDYRRLLYRAVVSRLSTTNAYQQQHEIVLAKLEAAFPGIGIGNAGDRLPSYLDPALAQMTRERDAAVAERDQAIKDRDYAIQRAMVAHGDKLDAFRNLDAAVAREARLREALERIALQDSVPTWVQQAHNAAPTLGREYRICGEIARAAIANNSEPEGGA